MTWLPRLVAITKTVTSAVTATHNQGRTFPAFQGVSSAFTTGASGSVAPAAATGAASATQSSWSRCATDVAATSGVAHPTQHAGQCSTTTSTRSEGTTARKWPACPGCPPARRPLGDASVADRRGTAGKSLDGGRDELV